MKNNTLKIYLILFTFTLFFPVRKVFFTPEAYLTGSYSDFTSFSLYLSDILLILLVICALVVKLTSFFPLNKSNFSIRLFSSLLRSPFAWLIFLLFVNYIFNNTLNKTLNLIFLINTLKLVVAYETLKILFKEYLIKTLFLRLYSVLAATQSLIAIAQFLNQGSLGLYKLGETHLSPLILGVAKIVSGGTTYIRGAGTFPHPNPLSAFLILGVLASLYLFFASESKKYRIFYILLVISNIFGVVVTFSRGAYLALVTSLVLFFGLLIYRFLISNPAKSGFFRKTLLLAVTVTGVSLIVSFLCFRPFLMDRATFSDQSTMDRRSYDYGGIEMMKKNPIFGVGMGESVLHMEQALQKPLQPWDKQPPHNFFILAGAELGVPTMLLLVWIFLSHLIKIVKKTQSAINFESFSYYSVLVTSLIVILLLMQFDHYFYTIQQTQLLLWVILALTASQPGQKFSNNNI